MDDHSDIRRQVDKFSDDRILFVLGYTAIFVFGILFFDGLISIGVDVRTLIQTYFSLGLFQLLFIVVIFIASLALYALRSYNRRLYATMEIAFGLGASLYAANQIYTASDTGSEMRAAVATIAGIYIIVRGFDNWQYRKP